MPLRQRNAFAVFAGTLLLFGTACVNKPRATAPLPPLATARVHCDETLWDHVYTGDPRRFNSAKDRLKVNQPCIAVTGTIFEALSEPDGDTHIRLTVDPAFAVLLNEKNSSGQGGHLIVEPVCMKPPTQADTVREHVCVGFKQDIYQSSMKGKHVRVVGAFVTDMEHGWNEIHPVTSITVIR